MSAWNPDPQINYYGHPVLFAGYNSWIVGGDELNGPGVNEPQWPVYVDSFIALPLLIVTAEMLAAFDQCPDYIAAPVPDMYVAQPDSWELPIGYAWQDRVIPAEIDIYAVATDSWGMTLAGDWPDYLVTPINGTREVRSTP